MEPVVNQNNGSSLSRNLSGRLCHDSMFKQAIRIIRELRDEIKTTTPNVKLPNSWLIKGLVVSVYSETHETSDLRRRVEDILQLIEIKSLDTHTPDNYFLSAEKNTPLFLNNETSIGVEGFTREDVSQFAYAALTVFRNHYPA